LLNNLKRILITGANGFIGKNLVIRLGEMPEFSVMSFVRGDDVEQLTLLISKADAVIHLAGENRPRDEKAFTEVNRDLTLALCNVIRKEFALNGRFIPLLFASSNHVERNTAYGRSKAAAEEILRTLAQETNNPVTVFRLPGVFGKWCKPNYNSVVATFCHNLARNLSIQVDDPELNLSLVYIDDLLETFINWLKSDVKSFSLATVTPEYTITIGRLSTQIRSFSECRSSLKLERVGNGFVRALYATYVSYLPVEKFSYKLPHHEDRRGTFVEMIKTQDSGQLSYFSAHPGITRGGHYHHTKNEKFLVIMGEALFRFRHLMTNQLVELRISGLKPEVVDTIPGWSHDITNVGNEILLVILWANENFDNQKPDTVACKV
jgi:UDP-2-acetamido-2,6-beta-L-arabino-hexul-4-ose reductase